MVTRDIEQAVTSLRRGGIVALPTETVYGLVVDPRDPVAVTRLYGLKARPRAVALALLIGSPDLLTQWADHLPAGAARLARALWPGPLTLVLPRGAHVDDGLTGGLATIGLRMPDHPIAQSVLADFGGALASTSANLHGAPSATTAAEVAATLGKGVDVILDGEPACAGMASTVVDATGEEPIVLRQGAVSQATIDAVWR